MMIFFSVMDERWKEKKFRRGGELRVRIFGNFPIGRAEKMFSEDSNTISNQVC